MAEQAPREPERGAPGLGFPARIGATLLAPRTALAASDHPEEGGKSVTDIAALLGLTVVALYTAEVVTAGWILASGEVGGGLGSLVGAVSRAVSAELTFLLILAGAIFLFAGRQRSLGRDLDLACTALVPLLVLKIAASLLFTLAGVQPGPFITDALGFVGYGWTIGLAILAVVQARARGGQAGQRALGSRPPWRRAGWGALAIWGGLIAIHGGSIAQAPERVRPVVSGDRAPAFELPTIGEGGEVGADRVALADLSGDVVVLEFWATWCGPCRASLPTLERIRAGYDGEDVDVVAINIEGAGQAASAQAMLEELGFGGISLTDSGHVANLYKVTTIPHLAVIGPDGDVALVHRGFPGSSAYERKIRETIDTLLEAR